MLTFPLHNAALDLKGKPPAELPHGLIVPPPIVLEIVERELAKHSPETVARYGVRTLNLETISWFFDGLHHEVLYRETPQGPEVLAVGYDEVLALRRTMPPEEQQGLQSYLGY
jgi:hypothetical protein